MLVPCGRCLPCRVNRRDQLKLRCIHEAQLREANSFVTLTYADEHLRMPFLMPDGSLNGSVCMDDISAFVKRLRDRVKPTRVRFLARTEYGPATLRAHAHLLMFGFDFPDRKLWRKTEAGALSYRSELLEAAWGLGHCEVSDVTPRSVGYVCNYHVDKLDGSRADDAYQRIDFATGEVLQVEPESLRMSTHPGIGAGFVDQFGKDGFPSGFFIVDGRKVPAPSYYERRIMGAILRDGEHCSGVTLDDLDRPRWTRKLRQIDPDVVANSTPERVAVREKCLHERTRRLKRSL